MPAPAIKICGIATAAALDAAITARADHVGLVFHPASARYLAPGTAAELSGRAEGRVGLVGLFVDPGDLALATVLAAVRLDAIQLHGSETPARAAQVRARFGLPVWKAVAVRSADDVARAAAYVGAAELILFDAKAPAGAATPGGLGLAFDWTLLAGYRPPLPWGLAGGLSPGNVAEAIRITRAPLVDVSSGVESAAGIKDPDKIAAFAMAARSA